MKRIRVEHFTDIPYSNFTGLTIDRGGVISYFVNSKLHRNDGPAREWTLWFENCGIGNFNPYSDIPEQDRRRWVGSGADGIPWEHGRKQWYYDDELISEDQNYTLEKFQKEINQKRTKYQFDKPSCLKDSSDKEKPAQSHNESIVQMATDFAVSTKQSGPCSDGSCNACRSFRKYLPSTTQRGCAYFDEYAFFGPYYNGVPGCW